MKTLITTILIGLFSIDNAQSISEIKSSSSKIEGRMSNSFYKHDISQFKKIRSVLKLDVFEYFDLKSQYDTELKVKVFKGTDDYKQKYATLEDKKKELTTSTYYLDFEPAYYERNNLIKYNLTLKTFTVTNEIYLDDEYKTTGYLQFDNIAIKHPMGVSVKKKNTSSGGVDFVEQSISFKIEDEALALKIEEIRSNLKLLFVFKFKEASPYQGKDFFGRLQTKYAFTTTVSKVIVYNSNTNEIYHTFE